MKNVKVDSDYAEVNGVTICFEIHGQGPPLLLIHGWGFSSKEWGIKLIDTLSQNHHVILMDNRGTGNSTRQCKITLEGMAEDSHQLLKHLHKTPANVFGYSMGGFIAQQLAIKHPESVNKLIVGATSPGGPDSQMGVWYNETETTRLLEDISELSLPVFWNLMYTLKDDKEGFNSLRERVSEWTTPSKYWTNPASSEVYFDQFYAMMNSRVYQKLSEIEADTLILSGEMDEVFPQVNSDILNESITKSQNKIIEGASHSFLWEKMDQVVGLVNDFLL